MQIIERNIADLIRAEYNPRELTQEQEKQLSDSLRRFGVVDPVIVNVHPDRKDIIIGGHQRSKVWQKLGNETIPTVELSLTLDQEKELNVRLNKNTGQFDMDMLKDHFETDDLIEWGFTDVELDWQDDVTHLEAEEDDFEVPEEVETDIVQGDLIEIGPHRLLCGDSTNSDDVERLMDGHKADMVFTDPPYGVKIKNTKGDILGDEDLNVFNECLPNIELFSKDNSHIYIYFGVQFISECVLKLNEYFKQNNILIQRITHENKPSPSGYFKNNYEVCYFSNKGKEFNSGVLEVSETRKKDSRYNGDGFLNTYLALTEIKSTEHNAKSIHPTQKTIEICDFTLKLAVIKIML